jgi:elongation factor P
MLNVTELKNGTIYKENNAPLKVLNYDHNDVGRGGASVKLKVKNLLTGAVLAKTYNSSASVEDADVLRKNMQYLYKDGNSCVFMDPNDYTQIYINAENLGDDGAFLVDNITVQVQYFEDNPVSITLPNKIDYEVSYTEPGFKGNTVSNVLKDAKMTNGLVVKVPTFVKIGDKIKVDTRTGQYVSRA